MITDNRILLAIIVVMFSSMACSKMLDDVNTELDTYTDTATGTATNGGTATDSTSDSATIAQSSDSVADTETGTGSETTTDTGTQTDSATTDTGTQTDSATTDTGSQTDSATTDTGTQTDSATADTGSQTDSATADTGTQTDSATTDTGTQTDSETTDTGTQTDSETETATDTDTTTDSDTGSDSDTVYICSEANCNGSCYACNSQNECVPVAAGDTDPAGVCADQPSNVCGTNGLCDGDGGCQLKLAPNAECNRSCTASVETVYTCDPDTHICDNVQTTLDCGALGCVPAGNICMEPCTADSDCDTGTQFCCTATLAATSWCSVAGNCVSKLPSGSSVPTGAAETDAYRCESGVIADGICCNDAQGCDGACEYCAQPDGNCENYDDLDGISSGDVCAHCMYCGGASADCVIQPAGQDVFDDCTEDMANECGLSGDCNGNAATPDCAYKLGLNDPCGSPGCANDGASATMTAYFCDVSHECAALDTDCSTGYGCNGDDCTLAGECAIDIGADAGCTPDNAFCCTDTDDDVTGCSVGNCAARIEQGGDPACSHDGHCVAGAVCAVDNVCCNSICDGECEACDGSHSTTRGTCASGATMDDWEDPDYCIATGETTVDEACRGTCSAGTCSFPGNELQCGDACDACDGTGFCDDVPNGVDNRCALTSCNDITMYQQLGNDGPSDVTECQFAAAIYSQTSNCNASQECLTQSEWCVAPEAAASDWTTTDTAHLCEGWGSHCVGTTAPSGSPDYFVGNEVCSTAPSAHCEPPQGAGLGPSCVANPPPRLIWPENGINLWAHEGNGRELLRGQRFVFDSPFASSIPELSGLPVDVSFMVEFSYDRADFSNPAYRLENCVFGMDTDFIDKIICTMEEAFPLEPGVGSGYIFWRAVQTYNYGVSGLDVVQYSNVWQFKPHAPNDVDGDGYSDVIIGRTYGNPVIFAGGTGAITGEYTSSENTYEFALNNLLNFESSWVAAIGDVNGDRISDFAAGDVTTGSMVYIIPGRSDFNNGINYITELLGEGMAFTITPPSVNYPEESAYTVIGTDVNGDGFDDIVMGEPRQGATDFTGQVYIFFGPIDSNLTIDDVDVEISGPASTSRFGTTIAQGGDIDGDGFLDLLAGAYYINQAYVFTGASDLPSDMSAATDAYISITGWSNSFTSHALSSARDINWDGYADVLVGGPGYDTPSTTAGAMAIIHSLPPSEATDITLSDTSGWSVFRRTTTDVSGCVNCRFGGAFAIGNFDGNSSFDLLVSARGNGTIVMPAAWQYGNVFIEPNITEGAASSYIDITAAHHIQGKDSGGVLGRWVANIGDIDGDGLEDMAWSDTWEQGGSGTVFVLTGADLSTFTDVPSATIYGDGSGEGIGQSICTYFTQNANGSY